MLDRRRFLVAGGCVAGATLLPLTGCSDGGPDEADGSGTTDAPGGSAEGTAPSGTTPEVDLPTAFSPVLVETIGVETAPVLTGDGRWRVLYEVTLTNAQPAPASLERIDVVDAEDTERVVATLAGDGLLASLRHLSGPPAEVPEIPPDATRIALVELVFDDRDEVPAVVAQRLVGSAAPAPHVDVAAPIDYVVAPFGLDRRTAATIGPPLRGGRWFAVNGLDTTAGAHRAAIHSIDGRLFDSQRFAIDWMLLDDDGTLATGDGSSLEDFHCYGADVLAVADGTVVEVVDGLDDQVPGTLPEPTTITLDTVDGNHVILEVGDGVYAFYAHLQPGSVTVAEGDTVAAGDTIGLLGNSGNTSAPHLHLHLMTHAHALAADSIPYVFDRFRSHGRVDEEAWIGTGEIVGPWEVVDEGDEEQTDRLPLGLTAVTFPD